MDKIERELGENDSITDLFKGSLHRKLICAENSDHVSEGYEDMITLSLDIFKRSSLEEALEKYFEGEEIQGFKCGECDKEVTVTKKFYLKDLPSKLFIQLKRFKFDLSTMRREKIVDRFSYPMNLQLEKYMSSEVDYDNDYCDYTLVGVVVHSGSVDVGHYYSFIKDRTTNLWYRFDDKTVDDFDPSKLDQETFGSGKLTYVRTCQIYINFRNQMFLETEMSICSVMKDLLLLSHTKI